MRNTSSYCCFMCALFVKAQPRDNVAQHVYAGHYALGSGQHSSRHMFRLLCSTCARLVVRLLPARKPIRSAPRRLHAHSTLTCVFTPRCAATPEEHAIAGPAAPETYAAMTSAIMQPLCLLAFGAPTVPRTAKPNISEFPECRNGESNRGDVSRFLRRCSPGGTLFCTMLPRSVSCHVGGRWIPTAFGGAGTDALCGAYV